MYFILVAADIFGNKCNFELAFQARPTLLELARATETAFTAEISVRRPDGVPPHSFHISKFKLYDEDRGKWIDLQSDAQLQDLCQTYAFQHENPWHRESQKEIPPAVRPPPPVAGSGALRPASSFNGMMNASTAAMSSARGTMGGISARGLPPTSSSSAGVANARGTPIPDANATVEEKVRIVFAEFDVKNQRMIDVEDLKKGFRTLGFDFSTATVNDLFSKGDSNHDGRISFLEFEKFARLYPIMTDCLYYRSKTFWEDQSMQRDIDGEREAVKAANFQVAQVESQLASARKSSEQSSGAIAEAENDLRNLQNRSRELAGQSEGLIRDKERSAKEKYDRETDANTLRERERAARANLGDLSRDAEKLDRRNSGASLDAQKAEERLKLLQQQLLDAQRALERAQNAQRQTQVELEAVRQREKAAQRDLEMIATDAPRIEDALRKAELEFAHVQDRMREMEAAQRDIVRDSDDAARRRDAAERAAASSKDFEQRMADELDVARRAAAERELAAKQREQDLLEQQRLRQQVSAQERALIEQELRLREQRESLEEKEGRLKSEASTFLSGVRSSLLQNRATSQATSSYGRDTSQYRP